MDLLTLQSRFALPGLLTFDQCNGLTRMLINTPQATATLFLQGAHLTQWQPAGHDPVIFVSRKSPYAIGVPIRGGIPIVFPWFAGDSKRDRVDGHPGPSHGFARIQDWTLDSAQHAGENLVLKLLLTPTAMSRSMGFDRFRLALEFTIGPTLELRLTVSNPSTIPLHFEQAFHAYHSVESVHECTVIGLEPTAYIDKTDDFKVKPASGSPIVFLGPVDRIYNGTIAPCTIHDGTRKRELHITKSGSHTTVVWNPGKALPDIDEWDWHEMLAVETANIGVDAITLAPGASSTLGYRVDVKRLG